MKTSAEKIEEMLNQHELAMLESDGFDEDEIIDVDPLSQEGEEGTLDEVRAEKVVRFKGGKRVRMLDCPKGYRLQGNKCVRMSSSQRQTLSRAAKKRSRKLAGRQGTIAKKRARSVAKRNRAGL